ncbi:MAG TPA: inositol monophosphatase [Candidatus Limnocylindria bacterium]|nr:inositol monophosphatase [Candidatus Limnocylindria bacterium]
MARAASDRYARLAILAAETALAVGERIRVDDVAIVTRKRGRANFATAADHAAELEILRRLRAHDKTIPILAEESADRRLRTADRLWVVDPLDGTLNFSRAIPFYCVAIAYVEDGRTRAAAVHAPRTGELFVAHAGGGATLHAVKIAVSDVSRASAAFAVTSLAFKAASRADSRFTELNATVTRLRVIGSAALEICYVACGKFDLFVHEALAPWDIAAAGLIAREAGAVVRSLKTGADAAWDEPQVAIGNPKIVHDLFAKVPSLIRAPRT